MGEAVKKLQAAVLWLERELRLVLVYLTMLGYSLWQLRSHACSLGWNLQKEGGIEGQEDRSALPYLP